MISGGNAGLRARQALANAAIPAAAGDPSQWTDAHEQALIDGLMPRSPPFNDAGLTNSMTYVRDWHTWGAGRRPAPLRACPTRSPTSPRRAGRSTSTRPACRRRHRESRDESLRSTTSSRRRLVGRLRRRPAHGAGRARRPPRAELAGDHCRITAYAAPGGGRAAGAARRRRRARGGRRAASALGIGGAAAARRLLGPVRGQALKPADADDGRARPRATCRAR